jgi:AMMECR1 domain-containing protein
VLTPLKRIKSPDEFNLGKQGIYIKKGNQTGTFLPQVAAQTGWSKDEFLGHCAQDKAGIGWNGWKSAELYTYEAVVFSEE